jgi:hypothetical protein
LTAKKNLALTYCLDYLLSDLAVEVLDVRIPVLVRVSNPSLYSMDGHAGNAILFAKILYGTTMDKFCFSDQFQHSQRNGFIMLGSAGGIKASTPLRNHVVGIVSLRPDEEMCWIYARRNVAFMTNEKIGGNFSDEEFIRNPICSAISAVKRKSSISLLVSGGVPDPTRSAPFYITQETKDVR